MDGRSSACAEGEGRLEGGQAVKTTVQVMVQICCRLYAISRQTAAAIPPWLAVPVFHVGDWMLAVARC